MPFLNPSSSASYFHPRRTKFPQSPRYLTPTTPAPQPLDRCCGDSCGTYESHCALDQHLPILHWGPASLFTSLPSRAADFLYRSVDPYTSPASNLTVMNATGAAYARDRVCVVCRFNLIMHPTIEFNEFMRDTKFIKRIQYSLAFEMRGCGHMLHEACLYAYLTETCRSEKEGEVGRCVECEGARRWVKERRWSAQEVEEAVDRIKYKKVGRQQEMDEVRKEKAEEVVYKGRGEKHVSEADTFKGKDTKKDTVIPMTGNLKERLEAKKTWWKNKVVPEVHKKADTEPVRLARELKLINIRTKMWY